MSIFGAAQYDHIRHTLVEIKTIQRFLDIQSSELMFYLYMEFLKFRSIMTPLNLVLYPVSSSILDPTSLYNLYIPDAIIQAMHDDMVKENQSLSPYISVY